MSRSDDSAVIAVVGVEATGKTTLAGQLAAASSRALVPELARGWLAARGNRYLEADLETIARLQWQAELRARRAFGKLVLDTDLTVIRVWSEVRFGRCAAWVREQLAERPPVVYLLPGLDLPWVEDPQRESPDLAERDALQVRYRALLDELGQRWHEVSGTGTQRLQAAWAAIGDLLPRA